MNKQNNSSSQILDDLNDKNSDTGTAKCWTRCQALMVRGPDSLESPKQFSASSQKTTPEQSNMFNHEADDSANPKIEEAGIENIQTNFLSSGFKGIYKQMVKVHMLIWLT